MARCKVVMTGAAGIVGDVLGRGWSGRYDVIGVDRRKVRSVPSRRISIASQRGLVRAFKGADVVVHLAADASWQAEWRSVARNNIAGTHNVLEAARLCGVRRMIFASSNAVTAGYEREEPWASIVAGRYDGLDPAQVARISPAMPIRPRNMYGVSKAFGEAACRYYSDEFGLSVICVRIGTVRPNDRPTQQRHFATLLTHRDLLELMTRAVDAPEHVRFETIYGVSANTWRLYDLEGAERIGFTPADNAEMWREEFTMPHR